MISKIAHQKCKHHSDREASIKCPSCGYFYCSECCTESDGRFLCSVCLEVLIRKTPQGNRSFLRGIVFTGGCLTSFFFLWMIFFLFGEILLSIPDSWFDISLKTASSQVAP
jgi:hypothetical protein